MNRQRTYLMHILESIQKIEQYTADGHEEFMQNGQMQDAVVRNFEIIGEATKRLDPELLKQCPQIPWRDVAGFRDILIHDYAGVDYTEGRNVIEQHVPKLHEAIDQLIADVTA